MPKEEKDPNKSHIAQKLLKERIIILSGPIDKELAEGVVQNLLVMDSEEQRPIRLFIDSPGGDASAGYAIFDVIRFVKSEVLTVGMGLVASAGALILLAAPYERRFALPNSRYLIHQPLGGIQGVATEIEIHAREIEKLRQKINHLIAQETGKLLSQVAEDTDRDYWMDAQEALSYRLVSRVTATKEELDEGLDR